MRVLLLVFPPFLQFVIFDRRIKITYGGGSDTSRASLLILPLWRPISLKTHQAFETPDRYF